MKFSAILSLAVAAATVSSFSLRNKAESMQLRSEEAEEKSKPVEKPKKSTHKSHKNLLSTKESEKVPAETRLDKFFKRIEPKLTKFLIKYKSNPAVVKLATEKFHKLEKFIKHVNGKANAKVAAKKEDDE